MIQKLNKYQKYAVLIPLVPFIGSGISTLTDRFRISLEYHWIYSSGKMICFALWFIGFIWAIMNCIYLISDLKIKIGYKIMWLILNFATVIFFLIMLIFFMIIEY